MTCAACGAEVPEDDLFCESCGERLSAAPATAPGCACGGAAGEIDEDGFCGVCGKRVRRPASDHAEQALSEVCAAVSDRGLRHEKNEDHFALAGGQGYTLLAVCDGVSSTRQAEAASATVAGAVARHVTGILEAGEPEAGEEKARELLSGAIEAAAEALRSSTGDFQDGSAPSTTVVAALVQGQRLTVAWMGDSRAYWLDEAGLRQLTVDDSWMHATLAAGQMTEEEAARAPQAHAITRWVGADADPAWLPGVVCEDAVNAGVLLLCSDGLWNYAAASARMQEVLREAIAISENAVGLARELVSFANRSGGQDNITVAILEVQGKAVAPVEPSGADQRMGEGEES